MYKYTISVPNAWFSDDDFLSAVQNSKLKRFECSCNEAVKGEEAYRYGKLVCDLQKSGLVDIASVHIPFGGGWSFASPDENTRKEAVDNTLEFLDAFAATGSKNYTIHTCLEPIADADRAASLKALHKTITEILPTAAKMGIFLNVENLPRTCLGNTPQELYDVIKEFPMDNLGVCFDVNHFCNCAEIIPQAIDLLAKHIRAFHISDYDGIDECHWYPGFGAVDWAAVMDRIRTLPNDLTVIFECSGFLVIPGWQQNSRKIYKYLFNGMLRNVFFMENAAEIKRRTAELFN